MFSKDLEAAGRIHFKRITSVHHLARTRCEKAKMKLFSSAKLTKPGSKLRTK
jgi:hypothetical protein